MPWEAGELKDMIPVPFTEIEAQVILDGALHHQYHQEVVKLDWNIFAQPLEETISKLESAEPDILLRKQLMAWLPTPHNTKSFSDTNKWKASSQAEGSTPKKHKKPQCPICGKFHHGECRYTKNTTKSKDTGFKGKRNQFKTEFPKLMKQMTEDSDGDSSGYSTTQDTSINSSTAKRLLKKFRK